jgi:hypothetical protein
MYRHEPPNPRPTYASGSNQQASFHCSDLQEIAGGEPIFNRRGKKMIVNRLSSDDPSAESWTVEEILTSPRVR